MPAEISRALAEIEAGLRRLDRPTLDFLNPGIPTAEALAALAKRGLEPPGDLLDLWQWRNGTGGPADAKLGDLWLVPGFYLLSVEDATRNFDAHIADPRWQPSWLPVFADGGGDFLAVVCGRGDQRGAVHHFRIEQAEHPVEYRSVERMLATFSAAFTRGAYSVDRDGWLEVNGDLYASIALELNPEVRWWTDPVA